MTGVLHIICTVFMRSLPLRVMVASIIVQTDPRWRLHVIHDGPAPENIKEYMKTFAGDPRITFTETPTVSGCYGHPNRNIALNKLPYNHTDFVLMTNDDNYYVPKFIEVMGQACRTRVGMVYCDTVHSYLQYSVLQSQIRVDHIDMGSFIVRLDIARKVGFKNTNLSADGTFAVECGAMCRKMALVPFHIPKPLFVHN